MNKMPLSSRGEGDAPPSAGATGATRSLRLLLVLVLWLAALGGVRAAESPTRREWTVDGVVREALVYVPSGSRTQAAPVVTFIHSANHAFPPAAPALIVKFFKEHPLP